MITNVLTQLPGFELGILAGLLIPLLGALGILAWRQGRVFAIAMAWAIVEALRMTAVVEGNGFDTPLLVFGTLASFMLLMLMTLTVLDHRPSRFRAIMRMGCSINAAVIALIVTSTLIWGTHAPSLGVTFYWCMASGLLVAAFAWVQLREARGLHRAIALIWILSFGALPLLLFLRSDPLAPLTHAGDEMWMALCTARLLCVTGALIALGVTREWARHTHALLGRPSTEPARPAFTPFVPTAPAVMRLATQSDDMSDQLERALRQLSHSGDMQSQMGSMMSHELRAPLSTISAAAQSLELILSGSGDLIDGRIARIRRSVGRMTDLLDTFFNPERARSGPLTPMPQLIDLAELAQVVIAAQQLEAAHELVLDATAPVMVWCDPSLCTVVARNLIHNAIKYSPANQPIVVQIRAGGDGQSGELTVIDKGVGIDESDLNRIFEPHYRRAVHREVIGTGIGLSLARSLCENQGGQLSVASTIGSGSRFTIKLPYAKK